ncbi:MAG TPA: cyclic nucleotide-binding domain-containing protein [Terriglobales bacterium]|nr:cyclic nucleotide-binding domain-containing protein [Terriglobales bacterium]
MQKDALAQLFRRLQFTETFPEDMLNRLATVAVVRKFVPHATLFTEKSDNDQLMIICSGRVALDLQVLGHGSVQLLQLGPGELLGWSALLGGRMTTTATAVEATTLIAISAAVVLAICELDHSFGYWLMRRLADSLAGRLADTRKQLIDLLTFDQAIGFPSSKPHSARTNTSAPTVPSPAKPRP